jgi:hypothetical protein
MKIGNAIFIIYIINRDKANDLIQNLKQQAKRESADFEKDLRELS